MDDTFRTQWTITPHLPDESSALVDETHRRTQINVIKFIYDYFYYLPVYLSEDSSDRGCEGFFCGNN